MTNIDIFTPLRLGPLQLPNRIVMAPMTRNRAGRGNAPGPLNATYYAQRASAALIISEATQISPQGLGYPGTPGIHSGEQVAGWRGVTEAVHGEWGAERVGVRLSPTNPFNDMRDSNPAATFATAVGELNRFGLAYLHVVESAAGDPVPAVDAPDIRFFRKHWRGALIGNKGYDLARANAVIRHGR